MTKKYQGKGHQTDAEYEIGYGRPPIKHRFKKGQSGNPKGRPRPSKSPFKIMSQELQKVITINENGQRSRITKLEALVKKLILQAMQGNVRTQKLILDLSPRIEQELAPEPSEDTEAFQKFVAVLNELAALKAAKQGDS